MADSQSEAKRAALALFGEELQRLRSLADISQRELAKHTLVSHQLVGAIERAERFPRKGFAEKADHVLNANGVLVELWPGGQPKHPHWFKEFLDLEAEAKTLQTFQVQAVPGLFQTKEYARAVIGASWPPKNEAEIERLLSTRLNRQEILGREAPLLLSVVLDEGVLRRPIGARAVMLEQLDHLATMAQKSFVQLQVLTFARGVHAAMDGSFVVLDMGRGQSLVYVEGPGSGQVIANADEVEEYGLRFGSLRSLALSPAESLDLVTRYKEAHADGIQPL